MRAVRFGIRILFGVGIAASLGFGAVQLTARPAEAAAALACEPERCNNDCLAQGYFGGGVCDSYTGRCLCLYFSPGGGSPTPR